MIKYNNSNINDWYCGTSNLIKMYRNGAVVYQKIGDGSSGQTPCFAVVDDISQYQDRTYEDVFNNADSSWYKLNNLNAYEKYGVYGSGRTITYYDGKLTIDNDHEYIYSGGSWNDLGEVSGSSRLPQGYTEVEYIENENMAYINSGFKPNQDTRMDMSMQLVTVTNGGRYISAGGAWDSTNTIAFDYENNMLNVKYGNVRGWTTYSNITQDFDVHEYDYNKNEFYVDGSLVGSNTYETYQIAYNLAIFAYLSYGSQGSSSEQFRGKMYWFKLYDDGTLIRDFVPCKRDSDSKYGAYDIVNDVFYPSANLSYDFIGGSPTSGGTVYPMYYTEMQNPPNNVVFTSMTEAESYECPWVGMHATIAGDNYVFNSNYEWEQVIPPTPSYKYLLTYSDSSTQSAACDVSNTIITYGDIDTNNLVAAEVGSCVTELRANESYYGAFDSAASLTSVTLNEGLQTIGYFSFYECRSLPTITIPNSVTSIYESAFQNCSGLETVTIGTSVTSIGRIAFYYCTGLLSITIPNSVTSIGESAFDHCTSLTAITCEATTPPTLGSGAFDNTNDSPIYVPSASVEAYKTANNWSTYASRIQSIPNS